MAMPQGPRCMLVTLKVVTPVYFHGKYTRYKELNDIIWLQILSYKTFLFNTITTISGAFLLVMNKSLHSMLAKFCTSSPELAFQVIVTDQTHHPLPHCLHKHCLVSINIQQSLNECQWVLIFCVEKLNVTRTSASYTLSLQTLNYQASLLPSVVWQQHLTECCRKILCHTTIILFWHCKPTYQK